MTMSNQIAAGDDDDAAAGVRAESVENHNIPYEGHPLDDGGGVVGVGAEDVNADSVFVTGGTVGHELVAHRSDGSSQLTLSFRGQVYVFDSVTPEKVQAVLLLLGGCELSSGPQNVEMAPQNHRAALELPSRCSQPHRAASLNRFRQKRKERNFDKKVRYSVRQEVALRMQCNKGQFTSAKRSDGSYSWGTSQESGQDDNPPETFCTHCGISSKSTPMMRRGPTGPRSLCNACGLFWANKGRMLEELQLQTQEAASSGAEVDEHAITRSVLGERRGHEKAVDRILKGSKSSSTASSRANWAPRASSTGPTYEEFATIQAQCAVVQAELQQCWQFAAMQQQYMANFIAELQMRMPNIQFTTPFPEFPNFNQQINPNPNPEGNDDEEEEEDEDTKLRNN